MNSSSALPIRPAPRGRLPHIVAVGLRRLKGVLRDLAPAYSDIASVDVLDKGFDDAVAEVRLRQLEQPIDVLVAAGSNGAFLRQHLDIPVVLVKVGGFDVMRALGRARSISSRIAIVTYGAASPEVAQFNELFGLGIEQRAYSNEEEARDCVRELQSRGIEVVVAPGLVADFASEAGMTDIFLYSQDAVREALDDAVEIARVSRIELAKRERLGAILGQLHDGVVAVDLQERIETLNPAMERLLGVPADTTLGRRLSDVAPELSLRRTLREPRAELEEIQRLGSRTLVISRIPIMEQGVQTGAVLTCQDPASIHRVDRHLRARQQPRAASARYKLEEIVGSSAAILRAKVLANSCARSDATVLITGESGTGKELLAQGIHSAGARRSQPFVAINCAAFPEALLESELFGHEEGAFTGSRRGGKTGLFEAAHTGTLFLDEVGEMPVPLQTRLLRALQEREILRIGATEPTPIDVRVIAATHRDLRSQVEQGAFRRDLYYRLNILHLDVPPLRERPEDVPVLAAHLLSKIAGRLGSKSTGMVRLLDELIAQADGYAWPGNVRELENLIERLVVHYGEPVDENPASSAKLLRDLAPELFTGDAATKSSTLVERRREAGLRHILNTLQACDGDRVLACQRLGISRTTLWRRLRHAGLSP